MPSLVHQLKEQGGSLFDARGSLLSFWQECADNFYPERADFTVTRPLGTEFASNLMTSYPLMVRRDLGNAFGSMLRKDNWFSTKSERQDKVDNDGKQWLAWFTKMQRKAMYARKAKLARATSEGDQDFATFGQTVIRCQYRRPKSGATPHLHHRCWHLRDVAWSENEDGDVGPVYRKWTPTALDVVSHFPDKAHADTKDLARKKPFDTIEIWHCVLPTEVYDNLDGVDRIPQPYVQIFFDPKHDIVLEVTGSWVMEYIIPRWATVAGSQYAHSPAIVAALPDGRLIQAVARVLLEAGEKATSPPMIGVREALRSDIDLRAGGFTAVDPEYDERMGEVLRPLTQDIKGLNFGHELMMDLRGQLSQAFFLNKLNLPDRGPEKTAYEISQRVQEFIRNALPLFGPAEAEYNGQLCETDMQLILHNNPDIVREIPDSLKMDGEIAGAFSFVFESPLREAIDKAKVGKFTESMQIISQAAGLDRSATFILNGKKMVRDVLDATAEPDWLNSEDDVDKAIANAQAQQKQAEMLALMEKGAGIAKDGAAAASDAAGAISQMAPA